MAASASHDAANATGDNTQKILEKDVKADLGTYTFTEAYGSVSDSALPVQITNISTKQHSFLIHIESVDANGNRITDDTVSADDLGAGQSVNETAFSLITDVSQANQVKTGTFRIIKVSMY